MPTNMLRAGNCGAWGKFLPLVMHSVDSSGGRGSLLPINMPLELQLLLLLLLLLHAFLLLELLLPLLLLELLLLLPMLLLHTLLLHALLLLLL